MKCVQCGNELAPGAVFCNQCGTRVQPEQPEQPGQPEQSEQPGQPEQPKRTFVWKDRYSILALIGVMLIAGLIGFGVKMSKSKEAGDSQINIAEGSNQDEYSEDEFLEEETKADTDDIEALTDSESEETDVEKEPVKEEPARMLLVYEEPTDLQDFNSLPIVSATATSTISQQGVDNNSMLMFDGRDDTSWQEGVNGYGIGEGVSASFDTSRYVKYLSFKLGNWKNDMYYYGNAKPKTMTIILGDFTGKITFSGNWQVEWVELTKPVPAESIRFVIDDVYIGSDWEDTCISEIGVWGE